MRTASENQFSRWAMIIIITGLSLFTALRQQLFSDECRVIQWDGYGYFAYLPGVLLEKNPGTYSLVEKHFERYQISSDNYQVRTLENGRSYPIYNMGLAVLWLPFFLLAHLFCFLSNYPADGMSAPYQWSVVLASIFYLAIGWIFLRKFLLRVAQDRSTALTMFVLALGTNYFYYSTVQIELTHHYLFSLYAIFLFYLHQYLETGKNRYFFFSALISGLLILVRSSEVFVLAIPVLYGLNLKNIPEKIMLALRYTLVAFLVFSVQLIYYYFTTGYWFIDGYNDHSFDFLHPHWIDGWFSYRRGWLLYTPIMIFALFGFYTLYKNKSPWLLPLAIFFLLNHYMLFSWDVWWYGNTFGSRPLVQSYALMSIPLVCFIETTASWRKVLAPILGLFIALNLFQTWQFEKRIIPLDLNNKTHYWDAFFRTELDRKKYVYLDTNQKLRHQESDKELVFESKDPLTALGSSEANYKEYQPILSLNQPSSVVPKNWIRITVDWTFTESDLDKWKAPKLVTELRNKEDKITFWKGVRLPFLMENENRDQIEYHLYLDTSEPIEAFKVYVWNQSSDNITIEKIKIEKLVFEDQ